MTDPVDDFIDDIHVELCRFSRCSNRKIACGEVQEISVLPAQAIYYTIGAVNRMGHKALPSVSWIESDGKTDPVTAADDGKIFHETIRLRVLLQAATKEACRKLYMNLRNAGRRVCGDQLVWGVSRSPLEEKPSILESLWAIEADADLSLAVSQNPQQLPGFPEPIADYALRLVVSATDQTLEHME